MFTKLIRNIIRNICWYISCVGKTTTKVKINIPYKVIIKKNFLGINIFNNTENWIKEIQSELICTTNICSCQYHCFCIQTS